MNFRKYQIFALPASIAAFIALIVLFYFSWSQFARNTLINSVLYANGTDMWTRFNSTDDIKDLRLSFNVFHVANADEVENGNGKVKIRVEEIGPFVYDVLKTKDFLGNNEKTGLITYKYRIKYTFNRDLSCKLCDAERKITWPNVPLLVFLDNIETIENNLLKQLAYDVINVMINDQAESAFITDTADNFIIRGSFRPIFASIEKGLSELGLAPKPWPLKDNKFALLYDKDDKTAGPALTVSAGIGGNQTYHDLNKLKFVDGMSRLDYWKPTPPQCNRVGGTDGQFFPPFINSSSNLYVYSPELCRKIHLDYENNVYLRGVDTMLFSFGKNNFLSYKKNPENKCYCLERDLSGRPLKECSYDGLIDLKKCMQPNIVGSTAHFYGGSPELLSRIDGLSAPDARRHLGRLLIEPKSGITLKIYTPFQINVRIRRNLYKIFNFFQDDEPLIFPLTWIVQTSTMSETQAKVLKNKLILLDSWLITSIFGVVVTLIVGIAISIVIVAKRCYKQNDRSSSSEQDPLLPTPADRVITNALVQPQANSSG